MADDLDRRLAEALERLGSALRHADQRQADRVGLSALQFRLLRLVATEGSPRRVGRMAAHLDVTQPTATDALGALAGKGLVQRHPDPDDQRAALVHLTPAGRCLVNDLAAPIDTLQPGLTGLEPADKATALTVALTLIADLYRRGVISTARTCLTCQHFRPHVHPLPDAPHHCALLDLPLLPRQLQVDCPEHNPLPV